MKKLRKQGEHNAVGETRNKIVYFLLDYPDGIDVGDIQGHVLQVSGILPRSTKNALEKLKSDGTVSHESDVWKISSLDFRNLWENLDFKAKLELITKRMIQDWIKRELYPGFVGQLTYAPEGLSKRLYRLGLLPEVVPSPCLCEKTESPFSPQEEVAIRTAYINNPAFVDFQLDNRPEIDLMMFSLAGVWGRSHQERLRQIFTPGYLGLLYVIVADHYYTRDLINSETLSDKEIEEYMEKGRGFFSEKFDGLISEFDMYDLGQIMMTIDEFSYPCTCRPNPQVETEKK